MIGAQIKIADIDYKRTFQNIFPKALRKWEEMESPNLMIWFLQKMWDASLNAALGILELLSEENKGGLLCEITSLYGQEIRTLLNHYLSQDDLGKSIQVGELLMMQEGSKMLLSVRDVKVDYDSLLQSESVQSKIGDLAEQMAAWISGNSRLGQVAASSMNLAARAVVHIAPDEVEKQAIAVITKERYRTRILEIAKQALEKKWIYLALADIGLMRENGIVDLGDAGKIVPKGCSGRFPKDLEEALLDAVSVYLKQQLGKNVD